MCEINIDEYPAIWDESLVRARKPHRCCCCRATIQPGEEYLRHFSVFDGAANPAKLCSVCWADRCVFNKEHGFICHPAELYNMMYDCSAEHDEADQWAPMLERIRQVRAVNRTVPQA